MSELRFIVAPDLHAAPDDESLRVAVDTCNGLDAEFVILLGDMVDTPNSETVNSFIPALGALEKPFYPALGNHETAPEPLLIDALCKTFAGPWQESFTYGFHAGDWSLIVVGMTGEHTAFDGIYVNRVKGYVWAGGGGVMRVADEHFERLQTLLEENRDRPTCLCFHVPLIAIADRLVAEGKWDQCRLLEEVQLRSIVQSYPNVKLILSGHQHFNQVDVWRDQLHCISQQAGTIKNRQAALRLITLSETGIEGRLIWPGLPEDPVGTLGTLAGDRRFRWTFPA